MYILIQKQKLDELLYIIFCLTDYKVRKVKHGVVVKQPLTSIYQYYREDRYCASDSDVTIIE